MTLHNLTHHSSDSLLKLVNLIEISILQLRKAGAPASDAETWRAVVNEARIIVMAKEKDRQSDFEELQKIAELAELKTSN